MGRLLPVVLALGLTIYTLIDTVRTREDEMRYLPKPWWVVLVLLVPVAGPVAWLALGRSRSQGVPTWLERLSNRATGATPPAARRSTRPATPPRRPLAPDDDPEFLSRLRRDIEDGPAGDPRG